jgi:hypothetical protein
MHLSLVMPYYRNPAMLRRHLLVWKYEWGEALKRAVEVVIVDDGSPDDTAADALAAMWQGDRTGLPTIALYRVTEDRPWHQHGARNLGAHVAAAPWLLMTDMDHVVPHSTAAEVLAMLPSLRRQAVLTFGRVDAPPTLTWKADHWPEFQRTRREDGSLKPHVNSFVVSRKFYWELGGYDEDFCGVYGTDKHWRNRLFSSAVEQHLAHAPLIRVDRDVIPDASTRDVVRKTPGRLAAKREIKLRKALQGRADKPVTLNFPWERVAI